MSALAQASQSFGRDRRLRRHADFVRVQGESKRVTCRHFVLLVAAQPGAREHAPARLGLVVTKRVGGAVARNRIKRVCRECFRLWPDLVPFGVDLVVIARSGADALGLAEVRAEWKAIHRQLVLRSEEALAQAARATHVGPAPKP